MNHKRNYTVLIGILGTVFEWLEYSYYGYITTRISQLFFPNYDLRTGTLASMAIFAAGFIMRPIGGMLFGFIGDIKGRKTALFLSLFLMGFATLLMGSLPTYDTIGIYAPLLLMACRLLQGLAVSGEFNGAAIFLIEHSKNNYPHLAGSWVGMASAIGMLFGSLSATIVSLPEMPSWLWRAPFFFACASCFIANYLRYRLLESPLFITAYNQQQISRFPLKEILSKYKRALLTTMVLGAFVSVYIYVCNVYLVSYLIKDLGFTVSRSILLATIGEFVVVITFPLAAILSDRIGHKTIMLAGLISALVATPWVFVTASTKSFELIAFGQLIFGISNACACAPIFNFIYKLFPTNLRYTGNSTGWGMGVALFGGSAPLVADYFMENFGLIGPSLYVSMFIILCILMISRTTFTEFNLRSNDLIRNSAR